MSSQRSQADKVTKPEPHKDLPDSTKARYEHPDIIDNRMLWEVLEEGESK